MKEIIRRTLDSNNERVQEVELQQKKIRMNPQIVIVALLPERNNMIKRKREIV